MTYRFLRLFALLATLGQRAGRWQRRDLCAEGLHGDGRRRSGPV